MLQKTSSLSHETKAMILESRFIRTNIAQFNESFNPKKTGAAIVNWEKKNHELNYKMRKMYVVKKRHQSKWSFLQKRSKTHGKTRRGRNQRNQLL